jgi:hypothetical protein
LVMLRTNMDICFTRFRFGFDVWCILSFIHFLSGYTRDMVGVRFGEKGPAISYLHLFKMTGYGIIARAVAPIDEEQPRNSAVVRVVVGVRKNSHLFCKLRILLATCCDCDAYNTVF